MSAWAKMGFVVGSVHHADGSSPLEFELLQQAFPPNDEGDEDSTTFPIPSVFINSEAFEGYSKIYQATRRLARKFRATKLAPQDHEPFGNMHVIKGTKHNNFSDVVFWMPTRLLQYVGVIRQRDSREAYREIIQISTHFLKATFDDENSRN